MKHRPLFDGGPEVSEIGFGAWAIGGGWWGDADDEVSRAALAKFHECGGNFYDTARVYGFGRSERLIGGFLRELPPSERDRAVVATKVPPENRAWPGRGTAEEAFSEKWVIAQAEAALAELGIERIGLLQLHVWRGEWIAGEGWRRAFERLASSGKVAATGVSINDFDPASALPLVRTRAVESIQTIYNIFEPAAAEELMPEAESAGLGIIVRCPFDEGSLTGKFTAETTFAEGDFRRDYFRGERLGETVRRVEAIRGAAGRFPPGLDLPTLALRFCLDAPGVACVIPGIRTPAQAEANARASDAAPLAPELHAELARHAWKRNFYA